MPLFKRQLELGQPLSVTDSRMTRFFLPLGDVVGMLLAAMEDCKGGETFVAKMPACKITDIAQVLIEHSGRQDARIRFIGSRPGERLHESLLSHGETVGEIGDDRSYFVVRPSSASPEAAGDGRPGAAAVAECREYGSQDAVISKAAVRSMLQRGGFL